MKKIFYVIVICVIGYLCFNSCFRTDKNSSTKIERSNFKKVVDNFEKALDKEDYVEAFKILNSIPSYFGDDNDFFYETGFWDYDHFTKQEYVSMATRLFKAEGDLLMSKDDIEAENLFIEHLSDFDLGANVVNIGIFDDSHSKHNKIYQDNVTKYNDYLISTIRKCLVKDKIRLANKIAFIVRDGLSYKDPQQVGYGTDYFDWQYDTEAKDEAKELIENYMKSN